MASSVVDDAGLFDENLLFSNFLEAEDEDIPSSEGLLSKTRKRKLSYSNANQNFEENGTSESEIEYKKNKYITELEEQNGKLKAIIKRLCGPHNFSESRNHGDFQAEQDDSPLAIVLFVSNRLCQSRKLEIEHFIKDLSEKDATKDMFVMQELKHQPSAIPLRPFSSDCQGKRFHKVKKGKGGQEYIVSAVQYFRGFCFDRLGEPLLDLDASITQNWDIPSYEQTFLKALPIQEEGSKIVVRKVKILSCFNCQGNHNLNECQERRDPAKIAANRRAFQDKFGSPSDARYHVSQEDDERFQPFKPGSVSEKLRRALGMSPLDLPPYIYRMRVLGYPPGYLKPIDPELVIYNAEGYVEESDFNEDGEIVQPKQPKRISYPGFNSPLPEGVLDRGHQHGVPMYQPEQSTEDSFVVSDTYPVTPEDDRIDMEIGEDPLTTDQYGQPPLPEIELGEERPPLPPTDTTTEEASRAVSSKEDIQKKVESLLSIAKKEADQKVVLDSFLKGVDTTDSVDEPSTEGTCRQWWLTDPLSSVGMIYCTYTPPPAVKGEIILQELPAKVVTELDREPWKTASMSWYDPLYGDLAERTGMYESIRDILKKRKKKQRKRM